MIMKQKLFTRPFVCTKGFQPSYTQPDACMTIGEMIERHIFEASDHSSEAVVDEDINNPLPYDSDLTDMKTPYQDGEFYSSVRRSISSEFDPNPNNLPTGANEKDS